jgi:ATP-dependent exoDNAse (exonuclease V) beta subunit
VPLAGAERHAVHQLAAVHGRVLGADADEVAAAALAVERVLDHPLILDAARAQQTGRCYRETPITLCLESGVVVEGNVDLAYETPEGMTVSDFKTDREVDGALDTYRRQVQIYAHAIARATGKPSRAVLMRI